MCVCVCVLSTLCLPSPQLSLLVSHLNLPGCLCVLRRHTRPPPFQPITAPTHRHPGGVLPVFFLREWNGASGRRGFSTLLCHGGPTQATSWVGVTGTKVLDKLDLRQICLFSNGLSEDKAERRRRGKISVNLLKLVWEFEKGGEVGRA